MTLIIYVCTFAISIISFNAFAEDIYLYRNIINNEKLDIEKSRDIFNGNQLSWADGKNIVVLIKDLNDVDDASFYKYSNLTKSQFLSRWRIKFFSGRALIPVQVKNTSSALDTLKSTPSGIFYSFDLLSDETLDKGKNDFRVTKISY